MNKKILNNPLSLNVIRASQLCSFLISLSHLLLSATLPHLIYKFLMDFRMKLLIARAAGFSLNIAILLFCMINLAETESIFNDALEDALGATLCLDMNWK